jgi:hypothetical protein
LICFVSPACSAFTVFCCRRSISTSQSSLNNPKQNDSQTRREIKTDWNGGTARSSHTFTQTTAPCTVYRKLKKIRLYCISLRDRIHCALFVKRTRQLFRQENQLTNEEQTIYGFSTKIYQKICSIIGNLEVYEIFEQLSEELWENSLKITSDRDLSMVARFPKPPSKFWNLHMQI